MEHMKNAICDGNISWKWGQTLKKFWIVTESDIKNFRDNFHFILSTPAIFSGRWRVNSSSLWLRFFYSHASCLANIATWLAKAGVSEWHIFKSECVFVLWHMSGPPASCWHSVCHCQPNTSNRTMQAEFTIIKGTVETKLNRKSQLHILFNTFF